MVGAFIIGWGVAGEFLADREQPLELKPEASREIARYRVGEYFDVVEFRDSAGRVCVIARKRKGGVDRG